MSKLKLTKKEEREVEKRWKIEQALQAKKFSEQWKIIHTAIGKIGFGSILVFYGIIMSIIGAILALIIIGIPILIVGIITVAIGVIFAIVGFVQGFIEGGLFFYKKLKGNK